MQLNGPAIRAVFTAAVSSTVALAALTACGPVQRSSEPEREQNQSQQDADKTAAGSDNAESSSQQDAAPAEPATKVPTLAEVKAALHECRNLTASAQNVLADPRLGDPDDLVRAQYEHDVISPWRDEEQKFENRVIDIGRRCVVHGSAGERFDPRISLANDNLLLAQGWLWNSVLAAAYRKRSLGRIYLKGVKAAADRAERVIDGRYKIDPDAPFNAKLEVPKYIEDADEKLNSI